MIKHKDCFILGAGFSCAYSELAPPMKGFLTQAIQSGTFIPEKHDMSMPELIRNTMLERTLGGSHKELAEIALNYFGDYKNTNIEQLATFLVSNTTPYEAKESRDRAYEQLLLIITNTLEAVYSTPRSKEISSLYAEFAQALVDLEIPVISFNYDLLLDQLLMNTKKWHPKDGYGVYIPTAGYHTIQSGQKGNDANTPNSSSILLKLHGSLNWGLRNVCYENGSEPVEMSPLIKGANISPIKNIISVGPGLSNINYNYSPYIIPPLANKGDQYSNPLVKNIWHQARDILSSSENIHILGYSFPSGDFQVNTLLRESLHSFLARFDDRTLHVVNRDTSTHDRANSLTFNKVRLNTATSDIVEHLKIFNAQYRETPSKKARLEKMIERIKNSGPSKNNK